jgi:YfiH family protein
MTEPSHLAQPPALRFASYKPYDALVAHAVFTRRGGVSQAPLASLNVSYSVGDSHANVAENRRRCAATLGVPVSSITTAGLVHGADVAMVETAASGELPDGSRIVLDVDALITAQPGRALLITAADCLQVMFVDPARPAIGLAHAGWRGLVAGVLDATVAAMRERLGCSPHMLSVGIGPSLGPCCARFSDPRRELPPSFAPYIHGHHVDLWAAAYDQLTSAGVRADHIEAHALCTVCHRHRFFSHRGDRGRTGRFAALLALRG